MSVNASLILTVIVAVAILQPCRLKAKDEPVTIPQYETFEKCFRWRKVSVETSGQQPRLTLSLSSPSGENILVGGFYEGQNTWKVRFSPAKIGLWSWEATLQEGRKVTTEKGSFRVIKSDRPGFVRINPFNNFRWVFDNGSPYYPIGIGDCMGDSNHDGILLNDWGLDGDFRPPSPPFGRLVTMDEYLKSYHQAGFNLFRWSVDNCSFKLAQTIDPGGNIYLVKEGRAGDKLVQALRQHDFRIYMSIFGSNPPFPREPSPKEVAAIKRYVKYIVDRYGAYVDFWELMNEATVSDSWYRQISSYLRSIDPYKHPIATSWEKPDLDEIQINAPHWYEKESEFESDKITCERLTAWKGSKKPVMVGEQGNSIQNWDEHSGLRMRLRAWTAFFTEGTLIFWNSSFAKDYKAPVAANIYLGPQERQYIKVLRDYMDSFDSQVTMGHIVVSNRNLARAYALSSPNLFGAYIHAFTNHASPTNGIMLKVDPESNGVAVWIDPATGRILKTQHVQAGFQTLAVPRFTIDIALQIRYPCMGRQKHEKVSPVAGRRSMRYVSNIKSLIPRSTFYGFHGTRLKKQV